METPIMVKIHNKQYYFGFIFHDNYDSTNKLYERAVSVEVLSEDPFEALERAKKVMSADPRKNVNLSYITEMVAGSDKHSHHE